MKKRILLTTFGSLGDLHPYIAIGLELQARGHEVILATSATYREKVEALGIGFRPVRPDAPDVAADPEFMRRVMDPHTGTPYVIRDLMMATLRQSYDDLLAAVDGADLILSHTLTFAARLVVEKTGIPWASSVLQPIGFLSVYDPPVLPPAPFLARLRFLGPALHRSLFWLGKRVTRPWVAPWHHLREELGLPPTPDDPLYEGQHAPALVLAMFSNRFAARQRDWPPQTLVTGFPFYDRDGAAATPPTLARFLESGPPPIVFTLGSSAVMDAGSFYEHSAAAAKLLGRRAVLLIGKDPRNLPKSLPEGVIACEYAPFSELFPRAAAIVHQGGIGTTGQAMRAGRPTLVMPYGHDQPDNAERLARLGISRTLVRKRYTPERAAQELYALLDNPTYAQRASEVARVMAEEDGIRTACDALEGMLRASQAGEAARTG